MGLNFTSVIEFHLYFWPLWPIQVIDKIQDADFNSKSPELSLGPGMGYQRACDSFRSILSYLKLVVAFELEAHPSCKKMTLPSVSFIS